MGVVGVTFPVCLNYKDTPAFNYRFSVDDVVDSTIQLLGLQRTLLLKIITCDKSRIESPLGGVPRHCPVGPEDERQLASFAPQHILWSAVTTEPDNTEDHIIW